MGLTRHTTPAAVFVAYILLQSLLTLRVASTASVTMEAELKCAESIYPCLDSYDILVEKPDLGASDLVRLLRVYVTQEESTSVKELNYVREFKLPPNNLLNLHCQFFSAAFKYYCFVYIAFNRTTGAVFMRSLPVCKPTTINLSNNEVVDIDEPPAAVDSFESIKLKKLDAAGPSLDVKAKSVHYGLSKHRHHQSVLSDSASNHLVAAMVEITCKCNPDERFSSLSLGKINSSVAIRLRVSRCESDRRQRAFEHLDSRTMSTLAPTSVDTGVNVCLLNLTHDAPNSLALSSPFIVIDLLGSPPLKVRDGRWPGDPLLNMVNGSMAHLLKSRYLRIESSRDVVLTIRWFEQETKTGPSASNQGASRFGNVHANVQPPRQHLWNRIMRPIHYSALGFMAFLVTASLFYTLACLTARRRSVKVQISECEDQATSASYVGNSSLLQFSFAEEADSMEMDYYDLHATLLPGEGSGSPSPVDEKTAQLGEEEADEN